MKRVCLFSLAVTLLMVPTGWNNIALGQQDLASPRLLPLPIHGSLESHPNTLGEAERDNKPQQPITQQIDLGSSIAKLAEVRKLSMEDARLEALMFLGLNPCKKELRKAHVGATFELMGVDKFEITADERFFENLPHMRMTMEHGMKQVVIQFNVIQIDMGQANRLNGFLNQESTAINCAKIPSSNLVATEVPNDLSKVSAASFVTTSTVVRENLPATTAMMTEKQFASLREYVGQSSHAEILSSPTIITNLGQTGSVFSGSEHPFVVGLERLQSDDGKTEAYQPEIQSIKDGTAMTFKALPRNGSLQLLGDISLSEIASVRQMKYQTSGESSFQTIQIPKQILRQVHFSTTLEPGNVYYIDPNFEQQVVREVKTRLGQKAKPVNVKTVFVMHATMLDAQGVERMAGQEKSAAGREKSALKR